MIQFNNWRVNLSNLNEKMNPSWCISSIAVSIELILKNRTEKEGLAVLVLYYKRKNYFSCLVFKLRSVCCLCSSKHLSLDATGLTAMIVLRKGSAELGIKFVSVGENETVGPDLVLTEAHKQSSCDGNTGWMVVEKAEGPTCLGWRTTVSPLVFWRPLGKPTKHFVR